MVSTRALLSGRGMDSEITMEDFTRIDLRVGTVLVTARHPNAGRLDGGRHG